MRNINHESCIICNLSSHATIDSGFAKSEYDGENLSYGVTDFVLKSSLEKAKFASQNSPRVKTKCCKCGYNIWTSSWYFKGIISHQNEVDFTMNQYGYSKKIDGEL